MTVLSLAPEAELLFGQIEELAAEGHDGGGEAPLDPILARLAHVVGQALIEDDEGFYTRDAILAVGAEATLALSGGDRKVAIDVATAVAAERTGAEDGPVPGRLEPGGRWSQVFVAEVVSLVGYECSVPHSERDMEFALEAIIGAALIMGLGMRVEAERRLAAPDVPPERSVAELDRAVALLEAAAGHTDETSLGGATLKIAPRLLAPASRALGWLTGRASGDEETGRR